MSASNEQVGSSAVEVTEDMVREYLVDNGDFLQRNPDLMDHLHINHASGSAVSLVEKQVSVLRERNIDMRRRLNSLTSNARDNDALYDQTRALVLQLLEAQDLDGLCGAFLRAMRRDFKVEFAGMILFGEAQDSTKHCRFETEEAVQQQVGSLLRGRKPMCGTLREEELHFLFPEASTAGSAAVTPLYDAGQLGLIAVGSSDGNRYSGDMGTMFLGHLGDVIVRLLPRLQG